MSTELSSQTHKLPEIMQIAAVELKASLQKIRIAIEHNLTTGMGAEEAVRNFLRAHLPESIGIGTGQIVDSNGHTTKQIDVVLFDAARTPILFTSEENQVRVFPAEGVIGVIEVKAKVTGADLPDIIEHMKSVKKLEKKATFAPPAGVPSITYKFYDQQLSHFPIVYSLFAFESSSAQNMLDAFNAHNNVLPVRQQIDNACLLGTGVLMHQNDHGVRSTPLHSTAGNLSQTKNDLLFWFLLNSTTWLQAECRPINLLPYVGEDFAF